MKYWAENSNETKSTLKIERANLTYAVLANLRSDHGYRFCVEICTKATMCSHCSELGYIAIEKPPAQNGDNGKIYNLSCFFYTPAMCIVVDSSSFVCLGVSVCFRQCRMRLNKKHSEASFWRLQMMFLYACYASL